MQPDNNTPSPEPIDPSTTLQPTQKSTENINVDNFSQPSVSNPQAVGQNNDTPTGTITPTIIVPSNGSVDVASSDVSQPVIETSNTPNIKVEDSSSQQVNNTVPSQSNFQASTPLSEQSVNMTAAPVAKDNSSIQPNVITGSVDPINPNSKPADIFAKKSRKKPLLLGLVAAIVLLIGFSGYVFAFYLPNTPENVWKTGLSRTGKEVQAIVDKISEPDSFASLSKNTVSITGNVEYADQNLSLNFDSNFDDTDSNNKIKIDIESSNIPDPINISSEVKTQLPENSIWPNIYFNISGYSSLGLEYFLPGINDYEGKWISLEQDFFSKYINSNNESSDNSNITQQDLVSILNDLVAVTQEYIFSSDTDKSILVNEEFIGTEESEGITANHYVVSLNKENTAKLCNALVDALYNNESYRKLESISDEEIESDKESAKDNCDSVEDLVDENNDIKETFDVWIDKKYKIIHKIRFSEDLEKQAQKYKDQKTKCISESKQYDSGSSEDSYCDYYDELIETGEKYVEIGQIYKSNDEFNIFVNQINKTNNQDDSIRGNVSININDLTFNGEIKYLDNSESSKGSANITITTQPYDGDIDSKKPEGTTPIQQVLDDLKSRSENPAQQLGANSENYFVMQTDNNSSNSQLENLRKFLEIFQ